ncbi:MAG: hypothetical protein KA171_09670 [Reyranella sp.]|nr:hypothetical protein [Reyranella sp.]
MLELDRADPRGLRPFELHQEVLFAQYNLSRLVDRLEAAGHAARRAAAYGRSIRLPLQRPSGAICPRRKQRHSGSSSGASTARPDQPNRSRGMAAAASRTAATRVRVKGSFSQKTAIRMAKIALVSRSAAAGAMGAWLQTQRISRYDPMEAMAIGRAKAQWAVTWLQGGPARRCRQAMAAALVIDTTNP